MGIVDATLVSVNDGQEAFRSIASMSFDRVYMINGDLSHPVTAAVLLPPRRGIILMEVIARGPRSSAEYRFRPIDEDRPQWAIMAFFQRSWTRIDHRRRG